MRNSLRLRLIIWIISATVVVYTTAVGASYARASARTEALVIDHRNLAEFERIPPEFVQRASNLRLLFRHASIGANIDQGLNCLMNNFPERNRRPNFCDRGIPPNQVIYDQKFDRRNWAFEWRGNPGWWDKVHDFEDRVNHLAPNEYFDAVGFNFNYADGLSGSEIVDKFFSHDPDPKFPGVRNLETLQNTHQDMTFVWWTMALPRRSSKEMQEFNTRLRDYVVTHNRVLIDIADIESHQLDGSPCTDNQGNGFEAICQDYTNEKESGHLNALGSQRMAKALWVLMAKLAGWNG